MHTFENATFMAMLYHLICFTDFVLDYQARSKVGTSATVLLMVTIGVHYLQVVLVSVRKCIRYVKIKFGKRVSGIRQFDTRKIEGKYRIYELSGSYRMSFIAPEMLEQRRADREMMV